jgi:predicted Zn-dependent protease
MRSYYLKCVFCASLLLLTACSTSPTGRSRVLLMSDTQMQSMGVAAYSDMQSKIPASKSTVNNQYVQCVARAITSVLGNPGEWEVTLFEDPSVNAFALPGKKIGVNTGLLTVAVNQDQLAAVMGHEVGHVLAEHGNERVSLEFASQTGQQLAAIALGDGSENSDLLLAAMGLGVQYGVSLPFSRTHESEADVMGLVFMARAGFDPRQSVALWKNMAANSQGQPPELLSTHPSHQSRIEGLQAGMPGAMTLYREALAQGKQPHCKP